MNLLFCLFIYFSFYTYTFKATIFQSSIDLRDPTEIADLYTVKKVRLLYLFTLQTNFTLGGSKVRTYTKRKDQSYSFKSIFYFSTWTWTKNKTHLLSRLLYRLASRFVTFLTYILHVYQISRTSKIIYFFFFFFLFLVFVFDGYIT